MCRAIKPCIETETQTAKYYGTNRSAYIIHTIFHGRTVPVPLPTHPVTQTLPHLTRPLLV